MHQEIFFPYDTMRDEQNQLVQDILQALTTKHHILVHAPTGLGKTIASLGPTLKFAQDKNLKVFFVTPRHTQHRIAVETVTQINARYGINIQLVDFLGKKWMCAHDGIAALSSGQFYDFCKKQVEDNLCEYYNNTRKKDNKPTVFAQNLVGELQLRGPASSENIIAECKGQKVCPYEMSSLLAQNARLIIADYYHVLHPSIREAFFKRCNARLQDSIIIIDEAHNVPSRVRELMSVNISNYLIAAAKREAAEMHSGVLDVINAVDMALQELRAVLGQKQEMKIKKEELIKKIERRYDYRAVIAQLSFAAEKTKKEKKSSAIGAIAEFLEAWQGNDFGFARIFHHEEKRFSISYRCLDPSIITTPFIAESYSTIAMSGTLSPVKMYGDLLGFPQNTLLQEYKNPFLQENRLNLIIPQTSTKYGQRNEIMFSRIAKIIAEIVNAVPGNSIVFFPSYELRNEINVHFHTQCRKTSFLEDSSMTKAEREELLDAFKQYKNSGAVLLATVAGSFSEGIDLPGDLLKCVVIVGVPLGKPDLETEELIAYYDTKFGKGWDYGYLMPAMTRVIQSAGRCIRTEHDRGVIAFIDERFSWQNYFKLFPKDWDMKITGLYEQRIQEFFEKKAREHL